MSDLPLSDDELLSSHLDGELAVEDETRLAARLADDPGLRGRLDGLRTARDLSATAVPVLDAEARDSLVAAALAATARVDAPTPPVVDLAAERQRRRFTGDRLLRVAAVVVLFVLAVPVILSITGGDDDLDTASFDDSSGDATADQESADDGGDVNELRSAELDESAAADADGMAMDDTAGDMDAGDIDTGDMDTGDDAMDGEGIFGTVEAAPAAALDLFVPAVGFDVLTDDLGEFDDLEELASRAGDDWDVHRSATPSTDDPDDAEDADGGAEDDGGATVDRATVEGFAAARFDELGVVPCEGLVDLLLSRYGGAAVIGADYATARLAGTSVIVGVIDTADTGAELVVIDQRTCAIEVEPLP